MKRLAAWGLAVALSFCAPLAAQEIVGMDDDPHYSRIFTNDKCRVYVVTLDRLEQTKPVVHEHDWARIPLTGVVEQSWHGASFGLDAKDGSHAVFFFYPADRVALRNPRNEPYREVIVEILQHDTTPLQYDPSTGSYFYPYSNSLGPGADPHVSYITSPSNTSVDIMNVQLVAGDSQPQPVDEGALIVAITDADLAIERQTGGQRQLHLAQGEVKWLPGAAGTFKNDGRETARFAIFGMK